MSQDAISRDSGSAFDPESVRAFLRSLPRAVVPGKQREVLLSDLEPGMVLAQGIYTANGVLLIPDGQKLTPAAIDKVINYNRINPISQSLIEGAEHELGLRMGAPQGGLPCGGRE